MNRIISKVSNLVRTFQFQDKRKSNEIQEATFTEGENWKLK